MSILFTNHHKFLVLLHILLLFIAIVPSTSVLAFDDCTDNHAPNQPTNPFPVSSSTDVSRQVILSWECVDSDNDELVYDVYFDSQLPMKRQTTKQNNTFFDPGLLRYNTRYYWMIVAYDPCGRLSLSRVWTFSTIQNPTPHPPSITLVEPQANAQNVSLPVTLSVMVLDEDNDPLTVTFYDESNMILESLISEPGKTVSWRWDDLGYNKTYQWYATVSDGIHTVTSHLFSFTTRHQDTSTDPVEPVASFTISPMYPKPGETIIFNASQSHDPEGYITGYRWDLNGDDNFTNWSTTDTITWSYGAIGSYTVCLQVQDNDGLVNQSTRLVIVTENHPPQTPLIPQGPSKGVIGVSYLFSTSTTDIDGDDISMGWDWDGNDQVDEWTTFFPNSSTIQTMHSWDNPGSYTIQVKAKDATGLQSGFSTGKIILISTNDSIHCPYIPSNPSPLNNSRNISLLGEYLAWECTGPDADNLTYTVYLNTSPVFDTAFKENISDKKCFSGVLKKNTTYYWKVIVSDENDDCLISSPLWQFMTTDNSRPPQPQKPFPANGQNNIDPCSLSLSWECTDPDDDELYYTVFFDDVSIPSKTIISNSKHKSVDAGVLSYDTTYYWSVHATDTKGEAVEGIVWSFKTRSKPCKAIIDGPTDTFSGKEVQFSGSQSHCEGGSISSYHWDFGDGETASGETVTHIFRGNQSFKVTLSITCQPGCLRCSDSTVKSIHVGNHPPARPEIVRNDILPFIGGQIQGSYSFTVKAYDPEGDNVRFRFDWGDNSSNTVTEYVRSGEEITMFHAWMSEGTFDVQIYAEDAGGEVSLPLSITVSIGSAVNIAMFVIVLLGVVIVTVQVVFVVLAHRKKMFQ